MADLKLKSRKRTLEMTHSHTVIVYSKGTHGLKIAIPNRLIQDPNVLGFHKAPNKWGGQSALFILINQI